MGHLHLLKEARARCDYLIVGVTTDELALEVKGRLPVVPLLERIAIVQSMRYVDHVMPQLSMDKVLAWQTFGYDVLFVGDNLRGTPQWDLTERDVAQIGVRVEYLPATYGRSGDLLERGLEDLIAE
jgi:glycerol-3-phosphate cytidylyltransferase